ncbi:MAG: hypothetical protein RMK65_12700 [Anaerolineae bacterium]|nr:DUF4352 domain-containing protein [Anaerolineae bacterium]MDW7992947.1 hypothetical protein [Anaerolineae bacterium]
MALLILLALRPVLFPRRPAGIRLEVPRVSPALSPLPAPALPVVEIGNAQVTLPIPVRLEAGGKSFTVQPVSRNWEVPAQAADVALWLNGTVVNYVLGLPDTSENRSLISTLQGDLGLELSDGARRIFRIARQGRYPAGDERPLAQSRPGLTLILLGKQEWHVVEADFAGQIEPTPETGPLIGPQQPVQVGDLRVTVLESHAARGLEGLPTGAVAYFVEFAVENTGSTPFQTAGLVMELVDSAGNRFTPSPSLAQRGKHGPLPGEILPGERVNSTAAYVLPEAIGGPSLTWVFGPHASSSLRARFSLPYTPPPAAVARASVEVIQAFLGERGERLHIVARIRNQGDAPLTISEADIRLSSSAGPGELETAAPALPWTIEPGQEREVELQFARPRASVCVVTILGFTFEISGMP